MNILIYCQHVLGIGHLVRTLEIARALKGHRVTLVLGGPPVHLRLPSHVRVVQLPGLQMDAGFTALTPVDPGASLEEVKKKRSAALNTLAADIRPDILLVELFPFGRNGFSFELLPLLEDIRQRRLPSCKVVCSVRDILVEKNDRQKYEQRVIERVNRYFDALLVHSDPQVIRLDATFSRLREITIPVIYTGFISRAAEAWEGKRLRRRLLHGFGEKLIVVSAGGGSVGWPLLSSTVEVFPRLPQTTAMAVFAGPYLDETRFAELNRQTLPRLWIRRFSGRFPAWLAAADLSISMGGYNSTMDILASRVPGLIYPFAQNREQTMRCQRLARPGSLEMLTEGDLIPSKLAEKIDETLSSEALHYHVDLDGALHTVEWLNRLLTDRYE